MEKKTQNAGFAAARGADPHKILKNRWWRVGDNKKTFLTALLISTFLLLSGAMPACAAPTNVDNGTGIGSIILNDITYNEATGQYSTAMGERTDATGNYSTAMGYATRASGLTSTSMGGGTIASGGYSTAMGTRP